MFRGAAELEHVDSLYRLGCLLRGEDGREARVNDDEAFNCLSLASDLAHPEAKFVVAKMMQVAARATITAIPVILVIISYYNILVIIMITNS